MTDGMRSQTLALAAAVQCLVGVGAIATRGHHRRDEVEPCVGALLGVFEGEPGALYGGPARLESGLRQLIEQLERPSESTITRYLVSVLYLERRLRKQPQMMARLGAGLANARRQAEYFEPMHPNVISNLAALYSDTISNLRPRIMVQGDRAFLEQPNNADLIRALLLSAIRAISLWREAGGNRWRLLTGRRRLVQTAGELLAHV
jgi:high frequency lysogenization protein